MENNQTLNCIGTEFNVLRNSLKDYGLGPCSDQKTSLGASQPTCINDKKLVTLPMPPSVKQKIKQSPPVGVRSDAIWYVIHSLIKAGYSNDDIIGIILDNPVGEKAHEKSNPYDWLEKQVKRARNGKTSSKPFDGYQILDDVIAKGHNGDPEAVYGPAFIKKLYELKQTESVTFARYRHKIKQIPHVSIGSIDAIIKDFEKNEKKSSVQSYFEIIEPKMELFLDTAGKPHIALCKEDGTNLPMLLNSHEAKNQLSYEIHKATNNTIDSHALNSLITLMEGYAVNSKDIRDIDIRHAYRDGAYYADIGDDTLSVIKIDANGVSVVKDDKLLFRRTKTMKPLSYPESKGDVNLLWKYVKLSKSQQLLLLVWIIECFRPETQYPLIEFVGEKGSGKSEAARRIRAIIDPNNNAILTPPKDEQDIVAAAVNNAVLFYDNLSKMSNNIQNLLCSAATGGSVSTRRYFTNFDEASVEIMIAVMVNSLKRLITQPDLLDRTISIQLPKLEKHIPVSELRVSFEKDYPIIFSGILDLFSNALKLIPQINPDENARMGDFVILGEAVSQIMGNDKGYFSKILKEMKTERAFVHINESVVGTAIVYHITKAFETGEAEKPIYKWLMSKVYESLKQYTERTREWPETVKKFSSELRQLAPLLEEIGIETIFHKRNNRGNTVTIRMKDTKTHNSA